MYIFLIYFFVPKLQWAQDCNCPGYDKTYEQMLKLKKEEKISAIFDLVNSIEKSGTKKCIGSASNDAAYLLYDPKNLNECLIMLQKVRGKLNETCLDTVLAQNYYLTGRCYFGLGKLDSSQVYYIKAAELAERIHAYIIQVNALADISWVFQSFGQTNKSIEYLKKAIIISLKINDKKELGILYGNLAASYGEYFEQTKNIKYVDSAAIVLAKGLKLYREEKNDLSIQFIFTTYANIYLAKNDFKLALAYCDSVTNMKVVEDYTKYIIYSIKSSVYKKQGNHALSLRYADSCYRAALRSAPSHEIIGTMKELVECYKIAGNNEMALSITEKMMHLKDSTKTIEVNTQINELEQKYNKAQNEKTIKELNQEKEILSQAEQINKLRINALIVGVLFLVFLVVAIVFFYRQSVLKNKFINLEIEQRLNRARMNPHFFFNALASLQAIAIQGREPAEISNYIHRFSKIMRESLESTFHELNTIENEIDFLTNYLELQKLRSDNRFTYEFIVDENIETNELLLPSMILQPFIENSIEHGFSSLESGGKIIVTFVISNHQLNIEIIDNGSGYKENEKHKTYPSRATQIIKDRLFLLNKQYKSDATFELGNPPGTIGTKVIIKLPLIPKK